MDVVFALLGGFLAIGALCAIAAAVVVRRMRRSMRVVPDVRSKAPLTWSVSPGVAANNHRRLRAAASVARVTGLRSDTRGWVDAEFPSLARGLQHAALQIEADLVRVSKATGRGRRQLMPPIAKRIDAYETTVARLVATADDWSTCTQLHDHDGMRRIEERIEAVRRSTAEVRAADAAAAASPAQDASAPHSP